MNMKKVQRTTEQLGGYSTYGAPPFVSVILPDPCKNSVVPILDLR